MIAAIALFELRKRLTLLSTYVYVALFFAAGLLMMFTFGGAFANVSASAGSEKVHANAPPVISSIISTLSYLGILMSAAVFGQAIHQDYEARTDALIFTLPIRRSSYLFGRFLGAYAFVFIVFTAIGLGAWTGAHSPLFIDKSLFGPTPFKAWLIPYAISIAPNLFFTGALFFALGTLSRKMMPVYVAAVLVVLGYLISRMLLQDVETATMGALLDPFGGAATRLLTRYWTVSEQNNNMLPLRGVVLENRALWSGIGLAILGFTFARFRMGHIGVAERKQKASADAAVAASGAIPIDASGDIPVVPVRRSNLGDLVALTRLAFAETIKNSYFAVLVLAAVLVALIAMSFAGKITSTYTWPVTSQIAAIGESAFSLFMLIIITFYAGEIVWRERDLNLAQITDALPIARWVTYLSKLLALCLVPALLLLAVIIAGVAFQTFQGYHHYELGLYFERLYVYSLPGYLFLCVLAFFVQSLLQNKYVGHFAMIVYYLASPFMDKIGLEHGLFKYGETPSAHYSDMNGFGPFLKPVLLYDLYWSGFALILAVAGSLFWSRGTEAPFAARVAVARERFTALPRLGIALGVLIALGAGATIYYNADVLNHFRTAHERERLTVDHEKKYKQYEHAPQPRITAVRTDFDLYPETLTLDIRGEYQLENKSGQPITAVYIEAPGDQDFQTLSVGEMTSPSESDKTQGFYIFNLPAPLPPGAKSTLKFATRLHDSGFKEGGNRTDVAENGTFYGNWNLPHLGYDRSDELGPDNDRKKYGLGPRQRMLDLHDPAGLQNNLIEHDADWVSFESTVSTSADQLPTVPGKLDKEWMENGRRYSHYTSDGPMLDFFSFNSARYAVRKDQWQDQGQSVALEIDYHPTHDYDVEDMVRGMKDALAYCSQSFGPYQFGELRIVEFPGYLQLAQSFPTKIPFSESIGFILRVDPKDPNAIDLPYYVTAHEVSHQWWGHQLIGANLQGVTLLDESLAQYSALMVMKARFGPERMQRFLKYELDGYLRGRTFEQHKELPLLRVEDQQYIHYNKGSLVMYALQDYIGEAKVNEALKALVDRYKFKGPPYATSQDMIDELKKVTPPEMQYLLHDLFEVITLYDNRAISATAKKRADGRYDLTLKLSVKKVQADEQGAEKEAPADDFIDIGGLDENNLPLGVVRQQIKSGETELTLVVARLPTKAGIDPLNKLIDRHPDDNVVAVSLLQ